MDNIDTILTRSTRSPPLNWETSWVRTKLRGLWIEELITRVETEERIDCVTHPMDDKRLSSEDRLGITSANHLQVTPESE